MFFEHCGRLCFAYARPLFFYLLLLIPLLGTGGYLLIEYTTLRELENRCLSIAQKDVAAIERKKRKERFLNRYAHADPFFLDKRIEALTFLHNERAKIESLMNHPAFLNKSDLLARLQFLGSQKNRLMFSEEQIRSSPHLKETEEKQRFPVQMDLEDLERLLAYIEDIPIGKAEPLQEMPQLILSDFKITKTDNPLHLEVYEIEMDLLKREWIKS